MGPCRGLESPDTLPCENDQAKPDRFSRLARSTLLSKILQSGPPKRCPSDRGPASRIVLELGAHCPLAYLSVQSSAFLRELFEFIELSTSCQAESLLILMIPCTGVAQRKILKERPANRPSRKGSQEINSWVMQWLVLCGIPYRGSGALPPQPDPANQLPTSHNRGRPLTATGMLHCSATTFQEYHSPLLFATRSQGTP